MATSPTPEQTARAILSIFVDHFKLSSGQSLLINNFHSVWPSCGLRFEDLESGMAFAVEKGSVALASNSASIQLTDAGFSEA
jgi:hypothetical protein